MFTDSRKYATTELHGTSYKLAQITHELTKKRDQSEKPKIPYALTSGPEMYWSVAKERKWMEMGSPLTMNGDGISLRDAFCHPLTREVPPGDSETKAYLF